VVSRSEASEGAELLMQQAPVCPSARLLRDWLLLRAHRALETACTLQHLLLLHATSLHAPSPAMSRPLSLFSVQAILILSIDDGSRILTKYYSNPHPPQGNQGDYPGQIAYKTVKDQKAFEKGLLGMASSGVATSVV
jgi:hypothetical protein